MTTIEELGEFLATHGLHLTIKPLPSGWALYGSERGRNGRELGVGGTLPGALAVAVEYVRRSKRWRLPSR